MYELAILPYINENNTDFNRAILLNIPVKNTGSIPETLHAQHLNDVVDSLHEPGATKKADILVKNPQHTSSYHLSPFYQMDTDDAILKAGKIDSFMLIIPKKDEKGNFTDQHEEVTFSLTTDPSGSNDYIIHAIHHASKHGEDIDTKSYIGRIFTDNGDVAKEHFNNIKRDIYMRNISMYTKGTIHSVNQNCFCGGIEFVKVKGTDYLVPVELIAYAKKEKEVGGFMKASVPGLDTNSIKQILRLNLAKDNVYIFEGVGPEGNLYFKHDDAIKFIETEGMPKNLKSKYAIPDHLVHEV